MAPLTLWRTTLSSGLQPLTAIFVVCLTCAASCAVIVRGRPELLGRAVACRSPSPEVRPRMECGPLGELQLETC